MRAGRVAAATLAWLLIGIAALVASLAYHLRLPLARRVGRDVLNAFVSGEIRGELRVGRIDELSADRAVARHVELFDPYGNRVAVADRVVLTVDLAAAREGVLRFSSAHLTGGTIHLIASPDETSALPTFVETFESAHPGPSTGEPLHAIVDGMLVEDTVLYGSLLGLDGLRVEDVRLTGRLEATDSVEIDVYSGGGNMVQPFPFVGDVDTLSAHIDTDPTVGLRLHAAGTIERDNGPNDVVAVNVGYAIPEGGDPEDEPELSLLVHGAPVHARFLSEVGYAWADRFRDDAALDGYFRLQGPVEDLELRAWAMTSGGRLALAGGIDPTGVDLTGTTPGLDLAEVVEGWPDVHVAGRGRMQIDTSDENAPARIRLEAEPFLFERYAIPQFVLEGEVHEDHLLVTDVDAPYAGGEVRGSGRYDFDGAMDIHVEGHIPQIARDPNVRRHVPDARGGLTFDVSLATRGPEDDYLRLDGAMTLYHFVYGPLTADRLRVRGTIGGAATRPSMRVTVAGTGTAVAGYPLGDADMRVDGGPGTYHATGTFARGGNKQLAFDAHVAHEGRTFVVDAPEIEFALDQDRVWRGAIEHMVWDPDRTIDAREIRLASGSQRLEAHGTWRFRGPEQIHAELQDFDLAALAVLLGPRMPAVSGRLDGHLELTGDVESAPNVVAEGFLRDANVFGVPDVTALYAIAYEDGSLTIDGQLDLGARGNLVLSGTGLLDTSLPPAEALENGTYDMELAVNDMNLAVARQVVGEDVPEIDGVVSGTIGMEGPIFAPALTGALTVPALRIPGLVEPWGLVTSFNYENGVLVGRVTTNDRHGELAELEGSLLVDLYHLVENPEETIASLESQPWRISVRAPPRRLGDLPPRIAALIPEDVHPLSVSVSGTFAGGALDTRGDVIVNAEWQGDPRRITCAGGTRPRAILEATLDGGVTTVRARGFVGDAQVVRVEAHADTPVDTWLREAAIPEMPEVALTAFVQNAPTRKIPLVCEIADGQVTAALEVQGLFGDRPQGRIEVHSPAVNLLETQPVRLDALANLRNGELVGEANLSWWSGERAAMDLHLPIAWGGDEVLPRVTDEELLFEGRFDAAPFGPFVAWLPQIEHVSGSMDGTVRATGTVDELALSGSVEIYDGYLELVGLGQHLTNVSGAVDFEGNWAQLRGFRAWDGEGLLRIDGGIGLDGYRPARTRLALNADAFPVRHEGTVLATLSGNATLEAEIREDGSDISLDVNRLDVRLPEEETRAVQELEPHPDIVIVGQEAEERDEDEPYVVRIDIDATRPFWVRRNDFSILVSADLRAIYEDPDLRIAGNVELRRGFFEVFGKRFVLDRGSMQFDGGTEIDPQVILVATHEMRQQNTLVTVTVTGTLTEPDVEFRSTHPECDERSEVVTMLIAGRCDLAQENSEDSLRAGEQAAGVLAGITAGVLTLSLRRELGDVLPVIAVETGDTYRSGRIRAGFDASRAIPDFLRGVVRGAYVEGVLAGGEDASSRDTEQAGVRPGFLIELQFPYDLVLSGEFESTGTGSPAWRTDFTWEP